MSNFVAAKTIRNNRKHFVVVISSESENTQSYWQVMKKRLLYVGNETVTNWNALKMQAADYLNCHQ